MMVTQPQNDHERRRHVLHGKDVLCQCDVNDVLKQWRQNQSKSVQKCLFCLSCQISLRFWLRHANCLILKNAITEDPLPFVRALALPVRLIDKVSF